MPCGTVLTLEEAWLLGKPTSHAVCMYGGSQSASLGLVVCWRVEADTATAASSSTNSPAPPPPPPPAAAPPTRHQQGARVARCGGGIPRGGGRDVSGCNFLMVGKVA